jgi:predicted N-formylglutamate amidohydrolase
VLQFNEVATGGGSARHRLAVRPDARRGHAARHPGPPADAEDVGLLQDRKTYRTHISWDVGIVDEHKYCMTRLDSWTNAAIVA